MLDCGAPDPSSLIQGEVAELAKQEMTEAAGFASASLTGPMPGGNAANGSSRAGSPADMQVFQCSP